MPFVKDGGKTSPTNRVVAAMAQGSNRGIGQKPSQESRLTP